MLKDFHRKCCLYLAVIMLVYISAHAQSVHRGPPVLSKNITSPELVKQSAMRIAQSAKRFGLELYTKLSDVLHYNNSYRDFMISPFAVWSLLLLLTEGAEGNTLKELRTGLHLEAELPEIRQAFRSVQTFLNYSSPAIEVASMQALFVNENTPVQRDYENVIHRDYAATIWGVDFTNPAAAVSKINEMIKTATRDLLPYTVKEADLENADLFLMSALFFRGQWKYPFNVSQTSDEMFYDEQDIPIGKVPMMMQEGNFRYATMPELEGHVLELPYGTQNRLTMFAIMPRKGVPINTVAHNLHKIEISHIYDRLDAVSQDYEEVTVEVLLPKFSTETHFALESVLTEMGMGAMFQPEANLSKITQNIYVNTLFHSTKIIVNEEGTKAAAVAGAVLVNKSSPTKFYLNHPFIYMIVEKTTGVMLFVGEVMNPTQNPYPKNAQQTQN